jgi:hypothetical protein
MAPTVTCLVIILSNGSSPWISRYRCGRPARPRRGGARYAAGCAPDFSGSAHFLPVSSPMLTRAQIPARSSAGGGCTRHGCHLD